MRIHHDVDVGAGGQADEADGFQILLRTKCRPHLVAAKSLRGNGGGFLRIADRRHIHTGAAIEANAIADASADHLGKRHSARFRNQIVERDFNGGISLGEIGPLSRPIQKRNAQGVGIGQIVAFQIRCDGLLNGALGVLTGGAGSITHQAVVRSYADQHGIALQDGAVAAVERQVDRFCKRIRQQK